MYRLAQIHSWSDKTGDGQPEYSTYVQMMPDLNKKYVLFRHN
jgi:hypothetical protein